MGTPLSTAETHRYVALLRAINVGGHIVKMDRLRALFEDLGLANVATFIASGNVIFDSPSTDTRALERQIEAHLKQSLGYAVDTFIRTPAELAAIVEHDPFPGEDEADRHALYVTFVREPLGADARGRLSAFCTPTDEFHAHQREVYWLCRIKMSDSPITGARLEKAYGGSGTMRNVTTVRKLAAKYADT